MQCIWSYSCVNNYQGPSRRTNYSGCRCWNSGSGWRDYDKRSSA